VDSIFVESVATVWAQPTPDAPSALRPRASLVTGCRWCRRRGRQGSRVANRPCVSFHARRRECRVQEHLRIGGLVGWVHYQVPAAV